MKKLLIVSLFASLFALTASAYQPLAVNVPIATQLAAITNQTIYTNTGTAFTPLQGAPARLVLNLTGNTTNQIILGFNTASDPNGTNFSTSLPVLVTFNPTTNILGAAQVYTALVPATNWDGVVKARFDYASSVHPGCTFQSLNLNYNY